MRVLVTGSAGHLGEALVRTLRERQHEVVGIDLLDSPFTTRVGSVSDREFVEDCMRGVERVIHTATLHNPHLATHSRAAFVETNIAGTLCLLEAALRNGVAGFVFSSTTSAFGSALRPADGEPAVWVTEELSCVPRNIYGTTKKAAEDLCELFSRSNGLPCVVLRSARYFPEVDDDPDLATEELGWQPRFDFERAILSLQNGEDAFSPLARAIGSKGYHARRFDEGPYPIESRG